MRAATAPTALIALALAGCRIEDPFSCALDEHCGSDGLCEPAGYCSFPDAACAEGRRYDELAGDGLAGQCVDLGCSAAYVAMLPSSRSRYRLVESPLPWLDAQSDCADDGSRTHLVVIESELERTGIAGLIRDDAWIGLTDRSAEGTFRWVTRAAATFTAWANGQPDNTNGMEDCAAQQRIMGGTWDDRPCTEPLAYVCECDGVASDPTAF